MSTAFPASAFRGLNEAILSRSYKVCFISIKRTLEIEALQLLLPSIASRIIKFLLTTIVVNKNFIIREAIDGNRSCNASISSVRFIDIKQTLYERLKIASFKPLKAEAGNAVDIHGHPINVSGRIIEPIVTECNCVARAYLR